jgi:glycosyltransferase involved in cell wall biosynthesis
MTIVVHTCGALPEMNILLQETLPRIIQLKPDHTFIFLVSKENHGWIPERNNVITIVLSPEPRKLFKQKWWEYSQLPKLLAKQNASLLMSAAGKYYSKVNVPQFLLLADEPENKTNSKKNRNIWLQKAARIGVISNYKRNELAAKYLLPAQKICMLPVPAIPGQSIPGWQDKELVKEKHTDGKDFFLYLGAISPANNILNLLKAFSLFKKRQLSNMQLVLAGPMQWPGNNFNEKLNTYKFRADVKIINQPGRQELTNLMGAAYACINMDSKPGFSMVQLEAIASGVPVISVAAGAEPGEGLVLLADMNNPEKIADQMKIIYKDEHLRAEIIKKGLEQSKNYGANLSASKLWEGIEQTVTHTNLHLPSILKQQL